MLCEHCQTTLLPIDRDWHNRKYHKKCVASATGVKLRRGRKRNPDITTLTTMGEDEKNGYDRFCEENYPESD
jgi:hypothetical protein